MPAHDGPPIPSGPFILEALCPDARSRLMADSAVRLYAPGNVLFLAGDEARSLLLMEDGLVKLTARHREGREAILALATPGDLIGLAATVSATRHQFDAIALSDSRISVLDPGRFFDALGGQPTAARRCLNALALETHRATAWALEATTVDATGRVAGRLLDLARMLGVRRAGTIELRLPLNQEDLGRMAATSREKTCRTLAALRAAGILDYRGDRVRIQRPDALERLRRGGRVAVPSRSASEAGSRRSRSTWGT